MVFSWVNFPTVRQPSITIRLLSFHICRFFLLLFSAFLKRTVFHSIISTCNQGKEHAVPVRIHSWSTTLRVETNQKQFVLFFFKPSINLFFSIQNKHIQNYNTHINNLPINLFFYLTI